MEHAYLPIQVCSHEHQFTMTSWNLETYFLVSFFSFLECTSQRNEISLQSRRGAIASPRLLVINKTGQCSWYLKAPADHRIKFKIAYFRTEADFPCFYDYIQLHEDESKKRDILRRFCKSATQNSSNSFQPEVYSTGQDLIVTYRYRKNTEKVEFVAVFEHVRLSEGKYKEKLFSL